MEIRVKVTFQHWAGAQMLSAVVTTMFVLFHHPRPAQAAYHLFPSLCRLFGVALVCIPPQEHSTCHLTDSFHAVFPVSSSSYATSRRIPGTTLCQSRHSYGSLGSWLFWRRCSRTTRCIGTSCWITTRRIGGICYTCACPMIYRIAFNFVTDILPHQKLNTGGHLSRLRTPRTLTDRHSLGENRVHRKCRTRVELVPVP